MLECRACLRRCVRALYGAHIPPINPPARVPLRLQWNRRFVQSEAVNHARAQSTEESPGTGGRGDDKGDLYEVAKTRRRQHPSDFHAVRHRMPRHVYKMDKNKFLEEGYRELGDGREGGEGATMAETSISDVPAKNSTDPGQKRLDPKFLQTELKYLKDPLKLADHVRYILQNGDEAKAQALVRLSSKAVANIVSWNHLIDWQMKKGKTQAALRTYNELKKRAQNPDSYTYLLLLRGLALNANHPHSLGRALALYHGMTSATAKVSPSILHTNAVLKVCARANDQGSMWDIISKLPESGPDSGNSWTFTTVLNHLRISAIEAPPEGADEVAMAKKREEEIIRGRRLWAVIVQRWRRGDIVIDEELVCAMGRLLMAGSRPRDWDDVLSLLHQTMSIPRLIPRLGTKAREQAGALGIHPPDTADNGEAETPSSGTSTEQPHYEEKQKPGSEFDQVEPLTPVVAGKKVDTSQRPKGTGGPYAFAHAKPSNNTLSLALEGCTKMSAAETARSYWDLLTDPMSYAITPDIDNFHHFLRVLRTSRSAAEAADLVTNDIPAARAKPTRTTFRLAMSACNRAVVKDPVEASEAASRVLGSMTATLAEPDVTALSLFAGIARASFASSATKDESLGLVPALQRLEPSIANLRSLLMFGRTDDKTGMRGLAPSERETVLRLFATLVSCYDTVLSRPPKENDAMDTKQRKLFVASRSKLARDITKARVKGQFKGSKEEAASAYRTKAQQVIVSEGFDALDQRVRVQND